VISSLVEETELTQKKNYWTSILYCKLYHIMLYPVYLTWNGGFSQSIVVWGNTCIGRRTRYWGYCANSF